MSRFALRALAASGLLLVGASACSLINSFDEVVAQGAGGSGAAGTGGSGATGGAIGGGATGGAGAGGGATGGGGAGPTFECGALAAPFEIFTPSDLGVGNEIDNEFIVVPGDNDNAHVIVRNVTTRELIARSVRDENLGPVVKFQPAANISARLFDSAVVAGAQLLVPIEMLGDPHLLRFSIQNEDISPNPPPASVPLPEVGAATCVVNEMAAVRDAAGMPRAAIGCDGAGQRSLWGVSYDPANQAAAIAWQLSGAESDFSLKLRHYAHVGGRHVLLTGHEDPTDPQYSMHVRSGLTAADLGSSVEIQIDPTEVTFPLAMIPNTAQDGVVLFTMSFDPATFSDVGVWTGNVPLDQLANLGNAPQSLLSEQYTWPAQADIAFLFGANHGAQDIISAGPTIFDPNASRVFLFDWSPNGALRLPNALVNEINNPASVGRHLAAQAVPGNVLSTLVVWLQDLPGGGGGAIVRGRRMQCSSI